jgi:hypothetical protein
VSEPALVGGAFAEHLAANRDAINQAVLAAARQSTAFDAAAFAGVLRDTVAPIVDAVDRQGEGFVGVVSQALVEIALDLSAQGRFDGAVRDGWQQLLPAVASSLAVDPRRVIASVTNALDTLGRVPGARPDRWRSRMVAVAEIAVGPDELLAAGQVAAWCSGMAAYRSQALTVAESLAPPVASAALGLASGADVASALERLRADPWYDPSRPPTGQTAPTDVGGRPRVRREVGAFRGFGGTFLRPPVLVAVDGHVRVTDGAESWFVFADVFGSAVVRAPGTTTIDGRRFDAPPPPELADVAELTGWASVTGGLVATSALSHAVLFTPVAP